MDFDDLPFEEENDSKKIDDIDDLPFEKAFSSTPDTDKKEEEKIDDSIKEDIESISTQDELFGDLSNSDYIPNDEKMLDISKLYEQEETENKENIFSNIGEKLSEHLKVLPVVAFVFVSLLGVYLFSTNIKADEVNLIRIEEKNKVGYINSDGEVLAKPKYISGTNFYKGYALVKNYNNLSGVLNGKAKLEVPFGSYFYIDLYSNRYIVSKFTNEGLKQGLLDENLKELTRFNYDNISYSKSGLFLFVRGETMGLMNSEGKEIYSYVVDEVDNRDISIEISSSESLEKYAKIKINDSSTIINTKTGKEVYKYTLSDIYVLDNNVFYVKPNSDSENNKYFVIKDDRVVYETSNYKRLRVEDINSNVAIGIKDNAKKDYINLSTKEVINSNDNIDYEYSDGVVLEKSHNFTVDKDEYKILYNNKVIGEFTDIKPLDNTFTNGFMKIKESDSKYGFINKKGKVITNKGYDNLSDFEDYGYAVVTNDNSYGVINSNGKEVIKPEYDEIVLLDSDLFNTVKKSGNEEVFVFRVNDKYGIINSKGKILIKPIYKEFSLVSTKYPIIKATYNNEEILINLSTFNELTMKIDDEVNVYENYITIGDKYYNYNGNLIYETK